MPLTDLVLLLCLPALLVLSGFFSGSETALFSLSRHQRLRMSRSTHVGAAQVATLLNETRGVLITLLLANMTINVLFFVITTVLLLRLESRKTVGPWWIAVLSVAPLLALLLIGEVTPKIVAVRLAPAWSRLCALPLLVVHRVLGPVRVFVSAMIITPLARLIIPERSGPALEPEELEMLLELSQQRGIIDRDEERLLQQALELGQLKVRDLMTPRVDVVAYDLDHDPAELYELIRARRFSKIPVFRRDIDHIVGVLYTRQVLLNRPRTRKDIAALVRQVSFVPELQRGDQLLVQFRKTGTLMAIVVDEYGGTAGIVTIRDVVEHIVGRISDTDEHHESPRVQTVGAGVWRVGADLPVREWLDLLGVSDQWLRQIGAAGVSTVGGLVMARLGRLPKVGDSIAIGNLVFEVEQMDGARIAQLRIRLAAEPQPSQHAGRQP